MCLVSHLKALNVNIKFVMDLNYRIFQSIVFGSFLADQFHKKENSTEVQ